MRAFAYSIILFFSQLPSCASIKLPTAPVVEPAEVAEAPAPNLPKVCVTHCGLYGLVDSCMDLKRAEAITMIAYARNVKGWNAKAMCALVAGWTVIIHKQNAEDQKVCADRGWIDRAHVGPTGCLAGMSHHRDHTIEVEDYPMLDSGLPHELGHVFAESIYGPEHTGAGGHCRWTERGIKKTLLLLTGEADESEEGCK